ncbi:hypothetical protein JHW45_04780 [Paracoccus stylophorae]|uniref:Uncharacterized protein n=1 Tax=Paracoccus stylophorae TaxID=659350 RepID=A0ABY7SY13_9RHOB|nr:protealysin inhibitor emfourin [Paracoccus stylophorae]WCR11695.1 hypothetical protein JHW45_04780 [Paracoccus stylophorae]
MIIEISSSGGFGGIPAAATHKRIDVDQQSPSLREEICSAFEPRDLRQLASRSGNRKAADMLVYRITVRDRQDGAHVYDIREDQLPPEILDLIDQM